MTITLEDTVLDLSDHIDLVAHRCQPSVATSGHKELLMRARRVAREMAHLYVLIGRLELQEYNDKQKGQE